MLVHGKTIAARLERARAVYEQIVILPLFTGHFRPLKTDRGWVVFLAATAL
jgi:hypothetical protein